ncbi:mannitol dehydrogenase family protein [Novosphingobium sp. ZW T3_23]|uniref:mannitol dehydrogenase family protein n=1 Tax=Novosphingobium sp. ZW T3_23 TaxID=3378084 RepID=UPI003852B72F
MGAKNVQTARFGIVHFGIGAFHRAHQAWYTDKAQDQKQDGAGWSIVGISLRSATVAQQLNPQDGLYTVTECSPGGRAVRVIGSVRQVLTASEQPEAVAAAIAAPETHIITFTVTEKGYCRTAEGSLDPELAQEGSIYPFLGRGLRRRLDAGLPGLTLLSCDNLAHNGRQLENLLTAYLRKQDPELAEWTARTCTFPCSMVDRIVPATTIADLDAVAAAIDMEDRGAVVTEPFSQWVIEDRFAGQRPAWERVGAELVADVTPYETAKLRLLNGAHSALAYLGLEQGHTFVHEAVADPAIRPVIEQLMRDEAAPTIPAAPGQDLGAYADALLHRFANPALNHRLIQIAMDGSQKITQRWLETLLESRNRCPAILTALAAWLRHVRGDNTAIWGAVDDPMAEALALAWKGRTSAEAVHAILGHDGVICGESALRSSDAKELLALIDAKRM